MRAALKRALELGGFEVWLASDGAEGLDAAETVRPDLVVLDILMPGVDGFDVCRTMRSRGDRTPILMLTARDSVADRVEGLEAGADDYLPKPFALEELLARVRALLRRSGAPDGEAPLTFADLSLDPVTYTVKRGDRVLELTRTEHQLLELLLSNPAPSAVAPVDLRPRVGLRLRPAVEGAQRLHQLPAQEDRGRTASRA